MTVSLRSIAAIGLLLAVSSVHAQIIGAVPASEYARLLKATRYVDNYKQTAAVSARVFSARAQGNDLEFARFMNVVAKADLSDASSCMVAVYQTWNFSQQDIDLLVSFFESPLGVKLVRQSQHMLEADLERGSHQPLPPDAFSEEEKRGIKEIQQNASYQKYALIAADRAVSAAMMKCIAESNAVKNAGIKF